MQSVVLSIRRALLAISAIVLFVAPVSALANIVSVSSPTPGSIISAGSTVTFVASGAGGANPVYTISDSFSGSSVSNANIDSNGNFSWTPNGNDVGTHMLTLRSADSGGNPISGMTTLTVKVPASLGIFSLTNQAVSAGSSVSFSVSAVGFINQVLTLSDSFSGTSVTSANMDASGYFSWTPKYADIGTHTLTISATDSLGQNMTTTAVITVSGQPYVSLTNLATSTSVMVGTPFTFSIVANGFSSSSYYVNDSVNGSSVANSNIDASGNFSWTPLNRDAGSHTLTILVTDPYNHIGNASATILVQSTSTPVAPNLPPATNYFYPNSHSSGLTNTQVQAILSLLQSFGADQTVIANVSAALSGGGSASGYKFTSELHIGMTSDAVKQLQSVLKSIGFFSGDATGYFGSLTEAAVKKFQAAHGLEQVGNVGPQTRAALNQ